MKTQDGKLIIVSGASRSGKSAYTVAQIKAFSRVAVWDIEAQFCELKGFKKVTSRTQFLKEVSKRGAFKLAYVSGGDVRADFEFFCDAVFYAGRFLEPLAAVAEELADTTSPAKAPPAWGMLVRRGLKRGVTIFAISQRWAEADKTALGNASRFVMFRQSTGDDAMYMSKKTRVPVAEINSLTQFEYVEYEAVTGQYQRKKLSFAK